MAEDDRESKRPSHDEEPAADPDRAAILARRQRFIALALSGLAGTAACDKPKPQPCLSPPQTVDDGKGDPTAEPQPCLNVTPVEPKPQPCLEVAPPEDTQGDDGPPPQPCLKVAAPPDPEPQPKPQPCLRVAPPQPKPQPKPQPCLKVAPKGD